MSDSEHNGVSVQFDNIMLKVKRPKIRRTGKLPGYELSLTGTTIQCHKYATDVKVQNWKIYFLLTCVGNRIGHTRGKLKFEQEWQKFKEILHRWCNVLAYKTSRL